jgi:hypothetical protein
MTLASARDWRITVRAPRAAVPLPLDDTDPGQWAPGAADSLIGRVRAPELVDRDELVTTLKDAVYESRGRAPVLAFAFCPFPAQGELARIELIEVPRVDGRPEPDRDVLEEFFTRGVPEDFDDPEVVRGDLPIGPAVRVRRQYAVERDGFGDAAIVQTLVYAVRPVKPVAVDSAVALFLSWTNPAYNDRLFDMADRMAPTLRLRPLAAADPSSG